MPEPERADRDSGPERAGTRAAAAGACGLDSPVVRVAARHGREPGRDDPGRRSGSRDRPRDRPCRVAWPGGPRRARAFSGCCSSSARSRAAVRGIASRSPALAIPAVVALLCMAGASVSGASFVGSQRAGASMAMTTCTAVALACYAIILFVLARPGSDRGGNAGAGRRRKPNRADVVDRRELTCSSPYSEAVAGLAVIY